MKTKLKKTLSVFLSIVMLFSITAGLDLSAYAKTSGNFEYKILKNNTVEITGYNGSASNLTIPSKINGRSVTHIGEGAFEFCQSLINVTIPNSVTSIGEDAFYICESLRSVTIPNSVKSIGDWAFLGCESLTSVTIPNSVKSIGSDAFFLVNNIVYNGKASGSPWGAKAVNGYVDGYLVYKNSTKKQLLGCSAQAISITIPNSVTSIGDYAFYNCTSLTSITIPDSVTSIGKYSFYNCKKLTSVTIPDSVTSIGDDAFFGCESLTSVTIGNSVTRIGQYAFYECESLTSVTIGNSVTRIGQYAFCDCTSLTSVTIGRSVTSIGEGAFDYCDGLTDVYYRGSKEQWDKISIGGYNYYLENATMHYHTTHNKKKIVKKNIKRATLTSAGSYYSAVCCSLCDREMSRTKKTIPKIKSVKLGKTSYVYDGKVKKPSVTVKDAKGKTLKKGTDYTVSYAKGRKNVGKYSVKITFKGLYKGTKTLYFTIKPKGTSISKLTAGSKKFTVKWYKRSTQVTGYQVQYSRNKSFKNAKTKTVSKKSTTSKTVSKLSAKKKYYVRVRTYKTVNGTKYYSAWSKTKTITTKK